MPQQADAVKAAKGLLRAAATNIVLSGVVDWVPWSFFENTLATDPFLCAMNVSFGIQITPWGAVALKFANQTTFDVVTKTLAGGAIFFGHQDVYSCQMQAMKAAAASTQYPVWIKGFPGKCGTILGCSKLVVGTNLTLNDQSTRFSLQGNK